MPDFTEDDKFRKSESTDNTSNAQSHDPSLQIQPTRPQNNKVFLIPLTLALIAFFGYLPFLGGNPYQTAFNVPISNPKFFYTLTSTYGWIGKLLIPLITLGLAAFAFKKNSGNLNETNDSWGIFLTAIGISVTYIWVAFSFFSHLSAHESDGGAGIVTNSVLIIPLICLFPALALYITVLPQKRSTWWWSGIFFNFVLPIIASIAIG